MKKNNKSEIEANLRQKAEELTELNIILLSSLPHPAMYIRRKDRVILAANKIALDLGVEVGGNCWRDFMKTDYISDEDRAILKSHPSAGPSKFDIKCSFCLGDQCFLDTSEYIVPEVHAFGLIWSTYWIKVSDDIFLHYAVNVTEHKKTIEALRQSEEKYHELFANNPQPMWIYDVESLAFLEVNEAAIIHYGYSRDEFLSMTIKDIWAKEEIPALLKMNKQVNHSLKHLGEWRHIRKNREAIIVEVSSHSVISHGKEARHVLVNDITHSKKVEEELKYEQFLLHTLMNNVPAHIYFKDLKSRFIRINKAQSNLFGLSEPSQAVGKTDFDFFTEEHAKRAYEDEQAIIRTGEPISLEEKETWADQSDTWVLTNKMPLRDNEGHITGTFGISSIITERKKTEEVLRKSEENLRMINAEKDKFFSIIAHDLKSPFNGFLGLTEIMAEGLQLMTLDDIQKVALVMRKSATDLYRLLGNLLEWSRVQRGLISYSPISVPLMSKISDSTALTANEAIKKDITISYDVPEGLCVFADDNMLEGIIRNLMTNAVKFNHKGGKIDVAARLMPEQMVEISVSDTGIGMNQEMIDNLFHLDINTCRKGTDNEYSTGLGLVICKDFIEKHGGKLMIVSEEGKGSTFRFTLPRSEC